jgi:hypothetical protein
MVPSKSNENWKNLISGKVAHNFKCVSAGLMISRMIRDHQKDKSPQNEEKLIDEAYNFFVKFESILGDDIEQIFK